MVIGWLFAWIPAIRLFNLLQVVGVFVSAWAAEGFARFMGAKAPWSIIAGVSFACSGLAATSILEGYSYHAFNPWLPLLAMAWYRALGPNCRIRDGVLTGVWFMLCVLTSAWIGLSAVVLVVGFSVRWFLGSKRTRRRRWRALRSVGAALVTVAIPMGIYLWVFAQAGDARTPNLAMISNMGQQVTLALIRLAGPGLGIDIAGHSQTHGALATMWALVAVAPVMLRGERKWYVVFVTGLLGLALSMVPRFPPTGGGEEGLLGLLMETLWSSLLRFPERLAWVWVLCGGVVASMVATKLAEKRVRGLSVLWLFLFVDLFLVMRLPARQLNGVGGAPSAYDLSDGPVMDLYAEDMSLVPGWILRTTNLSCYYQTFHERPIADDCLFTPGRTSPRVELARKIAQSLLRGEAGLVSQRLAQLGFTSLVVHPDPMNAGDRSRIEESLRQMDPNLVETADGGEHVYAVAIPAITGTNPREVWGDGTAWADGEAWTTYRDGGSP